MQSFLKTSFAFFLAIIAFSALSPTDTRSENIGSGNSSSGTLQQRIDFGSSQILGQSIKSGAVYLMHRKKSDISTMIEVRQHYRNEIKEDFGIDKTAIAIEDAEDEQRPSLFR